MSATLHVHLLRPLGLIDTVPVFSRQHRQENHLTTTDSLPTHLVEDK